MRTISTLILTLCAVGATAGAFRNASGADRGAVRDTARDTVGDPARHGARQTTIAGGPNDFLEVRHVVLSGAWSEIGRSLAEIAATEHGWQPRPAEDPLPVRRQRVWFFEHYPAHIARMRGVAEHAGLRLDDDRAWLATLGYGFTRAGCSVVYLPPALTANGQGVVSRNYDFTTGTFDGRRPGPAEVPCTSRPYLLELHPNTGYASLSLCAYDLLGGVVDGMNSEGLTVALLADDEITGLGLSRPAAGPQPGLDVLQVGRILLDTCASVEDAERLLRQVDLYYTAIPCHYLIADRFGNSMVWENDVSMERRRGHAIRGGRDEPLVTTNFMLHLHARGDSIPLESEPWGSFSRFRRVREQIAASRGALDEERIRAVGSCVAATHAAPPEPWAAGRTLWHALYFPEDRRLSVDFYLGDEIDPTTGAPRIRRSGYRDFVLR